MEQLRNLAAVENIVTRQVPSLGFHDGWDYAK
jgi:hypothetical protein